MFIFYGIESSVFTDVGRWMADMTYVFVTFPALCVTCLFLLNLSEVKVMEVAGRVSLPAGNQLHT